MIVRSLLLIALTSTIALACNDKTTAGCSKDTDCKGDRICVHSECSGGATTETSKSTSTPDPSGPSQMERYADDMCACKDKKCADGVTDEWAPKMNGALKNMTDKDKEAFERALTCALKVPRG